MYQKYVLQPTVLIQLQKCMALERFKFLSQKLSQSAAGDSMNRGSTCASVQGQIKQYVKKGCPGFRLRLWPESGTFSKSSRNSTLAKIPPEPDSFAGFELTA